AHRVQDAHRVRAEPRRAGARVRRTHRRRRPSPRIARAFAWGDGVAAPRRSGAARPTRRTRGDRPRARSYGPDTRARARTEPPPPGTDRGARRARAGSRELADCARRAAELGRRGVATASLRVDGTERAVRALDPRRVLERGYTITRTADGRVVRTPSDTAVGD